MVSYHISSEVTPAFAKNHEWRIISVHATGLLCSKAADRLNVVNIDRPYRVSKYRVLDFGD